MNVMNEMNECGNVKMWKCGNEPGVVISNGVRLRRTKEEISCHLLEVNMS